MEGYTSRRRKITRSEVTCKRISKRTKPNPECGFKIPLPSKSTITEIIVQGMTLRRDIWFSFRIGNDIIKYSGTTGISNFIGLEIEDGGEIQCMVTGVARDYIVVYYEK